MPSTSLAFETARAEGRSALIGYLPAGFPSVEGSITALRVMVEAGCDAIEIGLPYSDPVMDGPTIQAAAQQALDAGVRTQDVLRVVEAVAETGVPTLVMTYWNPIERYGVERWAADLAEAGGAGMITPDITPDYGSGWIAAADAHDLDKVFLVAPSSTDERVAMTAAASRGFVYAAAVMGVTARETRPPTSPAPSSDGCAPAATSPSRSASASATVTRQRRWRPSPTASSSARPSSGPCSTTPATRQPASRRCGR